MKTLIIGFGSIGKRHADVLKTLGCQPNLVTSQTVSDFQCYKNIEVALQHESIDYAIIANPTYLHHQSLLDLIQCDYQGIVLVEKPLFAKNEELPKHNIAKILVAYNLRFHKLLTEIKKLLEGENLVTYSAYVGQYLPTWRKNTDYRNSYSAKKEQGGGVLRDLSHELDYTLWLCGPCSYATAIGGHLSHLEINSDDVYSIMMKCERCPVVNIHVNYLDRCVKREITINTEQHTFYVDFIKGTLSIDGNIQSQCTDELPQTYVKQHQAVLNENFDSFCTYSNGISVLTLINTIEQASLAQKWMNL